MKNFTLFPLQSYRTKLIGILLTTLSIVFEVLEKIAGFAINDNLKSQQIIQILNLTTIIGLFLIVFSKEKIDDDRVKIIRLKSLQMGFGLVLALIIGLIFISIIHPKILFGGNDLTLISFIPIICYLVFFNIGLHFDLKEIYHDHTASSNINENKTFFLIYSIGVLLIVIFLMFI